MKNQRFIGCIGGVVALFAASAAGANHQNLFDNVTLHTAECESKDGPVVPVFVGSGASYWQPGHDGINTTWNLCVNIIGGAFADEVVTVQDLDEGPMARIFGLHGNRHFRLDYRPAPYVEYLNVELSAAPSLYDYQLANRLGADRSFRLLQNLAEISTNSPKLR